MNDEIASARKVFAEFQEQHRKRLGRSGFWWLNFDDDGDEDKQRGLAVLLHKQLIRHHGMEGFRLTERGTEACLHPEQLDGYLGPARSSAPQEITINTASMHHTQIGHGNTMNVTYSQILTALADEVEESDKGSAEEKRTIATRLRDLSKHPLVVGLALAAGKFGLDHLK